MAPKDVGSPEPFVDAVRKGMSEFVLLTPVKARPVLVITGALPGHEEVLALRLRRLEKLSSDAVRQQVRSGGDPALFHLRPRRFPGLPAENAAIVTSLLRLPVEALDRRKSLGALDEDELRVLHERVVGAHGLRLDMLIFKRARALIAQARQELIPSEHDVDSLPDPLPLGPGQEPPSSVLDRLRRDER
jgi:hypothetical protein